MRSLVRFASTTAKEILYLLRLWTPRVPQTLSDATSGFVAANAPHWPRPERTRPERILIEGHLSEYGPNYLLRTAVAARAIHEKTSMSMEVVFNGYSHQWVVPSTIYRSFGITDALYLANRFALANIVYFCVAWFYGLWSTARLKKPDDILSIRFGSVKVGDLVYDDIIRQTKRKTVHALDGHVAKALRKSYFYFLQYRRLFTRRRYAYYVSTHTAYSEYGLLCRVALMNGAKVIETTDIQMSFYDQISADRLPTYHEGIRESVVAALTDAREELAELRAAAQESLNLRLESQVGQLDVQKAYAGRVYSKRELQQELTIDPEHKVVFLLAHVFADAPHLSSGMLHSDYYRWLSSTLDVCARSTGVTWIVKPHPSSALYGEGGLVEAMVERYHTRSIIMCPNDLNTKSLRACADALVTVHGTAGLEFACLGIPVVLAGKPFYSGFGFTVEPRSVEEYERTMLSLKDVVPLTESQIDKALHVYAIWNRQFDWNNPIITPDVLANVWGSGLPRNVAKAYDLLTEHVLRTNPRTLKLWEFAQAVAE